MSTKRFFITTASVIALGAVTAGIAFAAWSASGSGPGSSKALTAQPLIVTGLTLGPAAATLYPGGPGGTIYYTVDNPNPYPVEITHVTWGTPLSADTIDCPSANLSLSPSAQTSFTTIVPSSKSSDSTFSVSGIVDLASSAPDGCQGVNVTIPMALTGTQSS